MGRWTVHLSMSITATMAWLARLTLIHGPISHVRIRTSKHAMQEGMPLLQRLVQGRGEAAVVLNFGLWHHDEHVYRTLLRQLADEVWSSMVNVWICLCLSCSRRSRHRVHHNICTALSSINCKHLAHLH